MIIKNKNVWAFYSIAIGLFLTPYLLRDKIIVSGIYPINILVWAGVLGITIWKNGISSKIRLQRKKSITIFLFVLTLILLSIQGMQLKQSTLMDYLRFYIAVIIPAVLVFINTDEINTVRLFNIVLKILNFSVLIIVGCGFLDVLSGHKVSAFFAGFYDVASLYSCYDQHRIVSFMGHSLLTAEIGILYFILNYIDSLYFHPKRKRIVFIGISFILAAMTGSKTALIILLFMSLFVNMDLKNIKYVFLICVVLVCLLYLGVFDMIIDRFLYWHEIGDITSGRNSAFSELYQSGVIKFSLLRGNDTGLSTTSLIAAAEYPIIRWAYRYGIVWTCILCSGIFIYPVFYIIKRGRNFKILILYLGFMFFVNTYSTLQSIQDGMLIFCMMTCLIKNVSECIRRKEVERNSVKNN